MAGEFWDDFCQHTVNPRAVIFGLCILSIGQAQAQQKYLEPPEAAKELFASRPMPRVSLSPGLDQRHLLVAEEFRFRRIEEMAQREVALAGVRLNPFNNGPTHPDYFFRLTLKELATGKTIPVQLPNAARRVSLPVWSPDGKKFAFLQYGRTSVALWVGELGHAPRAMPGVKLNATLECEVAGRHVYTFVVHGASDQLKHRRIVLAAEVFRGVPPRPRHVSRRHLLLRQIVAEVRCSA